MSEVQGEERIQELLLDSACHSGGVGWPGLQRGTVLSFSKSEAREHFTKYVSVEAEYSVYRRADWRLSSRGRKYAETTGCTATAARQIKIQIL